MDHIKGEFPGGQSCTLDLNGHNACNLPHKFLLPILFSLVFYAASFSVLMVGWFAKNFLRHGKTVHLIHSKESDHHRICHVPKRYFAHFYIVGLLWTLFLPVLSPYFIYPFDEFLQEWLMKLTGLHLDDILLQPRVHLNVSIQYIIYLCIISQLARRSIETISSFSSSGTMHVFHYIAGYGFYIGMPLVYLYEVSFWIRASGSSLFISQLALEKFSSHPSDSIKSALRALLILINSNTIVSISLMLFVYFWYMQYTCHAYLSRLRDAPCSDIDSDPVDSRLAQIKQRYPLPIQGMFQWITCPHYFAEIGMYTSLSFIVFTLSGRCLPTYSYLIESLSSFQWKTFVIAVIWIWSHPEISVVFWTVTVLSVSAKETRNWYYELYGTRTPKYCLIPFLF